MRKVTRRVQRDTKATQMITEGSCHLDYMATICAGPEEGIILSGIPLRENAWGWSHGHQELLQRSKTREGEKTLTSKELSAVGTSSR